MPKHIPTYIERLEQKAIKRTKLEEVHDSKYRRVNIKESYALACHYAEMEVEYLARRFLKYHSKTLREFVMCMGKWHFVSKDLEIIDPYETGKYKCQELMEFIDEWDPYLKLTGFPMRFTADGEKITDW